MVARGNQWQPRTNAPPYVPPMCPYVFPSCPLCTPACPYVPPHAPYVPLCTPYVPLCAPTCPLCAPTCPYMPPMRPLCAPYMPLHAPYAPSTGPLCAPYAPLHAPYTPPTLVSDLLRFLNVPTIANQMTGIDQAHYHKILIFFPTTSLKCLCAARIDELADSNEPAKKFYSVNTTDTELIRKQYSYIKGSAAKHFSVCAR